MAQELRVTVIRSRGTYAQPDREITIVDIIATMILVGVWFLVGLGYGYLLASL